MPRPAVWFLAALLFAHWLLWTAGFARSASGQSREWSGSSMLSADRVGFSARPAPPAGYERGLLSLAFDDGDVSQLDNAWPLMQKYGLRATFYISTGRLGDGWWMPPSGVVALHQGGNEIAGHSVSHPHLTRLSAEEIDYELSASKAYLESLIGAPVRNFGSPHGDVNDAVLDQIRQYYRSHKSNGYGFNQRGSIDVYRLNTIATGPGDSADQVTAWIQQAQRDRSWLILTYHQVLRADRAWFESHLAAITASGIAVVTVDQALDELEAQ